ncbi:hypothetical protein M422DRAFT_43522 [Sphaerobolus stellatus SS14]|nr:hypothetical protein M422DRAFT_43522 [Sphaerobolus stellatus SS14]
MQANNNDGTNLNAAVDPTMEGNNKELQETLPLSCLPSEIFDEQAAAHNAPAIEHGLPGGCLSIPASLSNDLTMFPAEVQGVLRTPEMLQKMISMINSPQDVNAIPI